MGKQFDGHYFDGKSSSRLPVTVSLHTRGLSLAGPGGFTAMWPYTEVRQAQGAYPGQVARLERLPLRLEVLVVDHPGFLAGLAEQAQAVAPKAFQAVHDQRGLASRLGVALVGVVAVAGLYYTQLIPAVAGVAAPYVPVAWEEALGRRVVDQMAPKSERVTTPQRVGPVEAVVATLAPHLGQRYRYRVVVWKSGEVNAFAAPGGYLVVTEGMLHATHSPDELAGVIAHELQHVKLQHTTKSMLQNLGLQALMTATTFDMGFRTMAWLLGTMSYSRDAESQADREGMALLQDAHLDPQGMVKVFKMLEKLDPDEDPGLTLLSTHPATHDRVVAIQAMAKQAHYKPVKLLPDVDWEVVRGRDKDLED